MGSFLPLTSVRFEAARYEPVLTEKFYPLLARHLAEKARAPRTLHRLGLNSQSISGGVGCLLSKWKNGENTPRGENTLEESSSLKLFCIIFRYLAGVKLEPRIFCLASR